MDRKCKNRGESGAEAMIKKESWIYAPVDGTCISMETVADPVFAEELLGEGIAIAPADGRFYAPADAQVTVLPDSLHAAGFITAAGEELLLHIGLDTVKLNGRYFKTHVRQGDMVLKGDLLLEADLQAIRNAGFQTVTMLLVCSHRVCRETMPLPGKKITHGNAVFYTIGNQDKR